MAAVFLRVIPAMATAVLPPLLRGVNASIEQHLKGVLFTAAAALLGLMLTVLWEAIRPRAGELYPGEWTLVTGVLQSINGVQGLVLLGVLCAPVVYTLMSHTPVLTVVVSFVLLQRALQLYGPLSDAGVYAVVKYALRTTLPSTATSMHALHVPTVCIALAAQLLRVAWSLQVVQFSLAQRLGQDRRWMTPLLDGTVQLVLVVLGVFPLNITLLMRSMFTLLLHVHLVYHATAITFWPCVLAWFARAAVTNGWWPGPTELLGLVGVYRQLPTALHARLVVALRGVVILLIVLRQASACNSLIERLEPDSTLPYVAVWVVTGLLLAVYSYDTFWYDLQARQGGVLWFFTGCSLLCKRWQDVPVLSDRESLITTRTLHDWAGLQQKVEQDKLKKEEKAEREAKIDSAGNELLDPRSEAARRILANAVAQPPPNAVQLCFYNSTGGLKILKPLHPSRGRVWSASEYDSAQANSTEEAKMDDKTVQVLLYGKTGAGKSQLASALTGTRFVSGIENGSSIIPQAAPMHHHAEDGELRLLLVDAPGCRQAIVSRARTLFVRAPPPDDAATQALTVEHIDAVIRQLMASMSVLLFVVNAEPINPDFVLDFQECLTAMKDSLRPAHCKATDEDLQQMCLSRIIIVRNKCDLIMRNCYNPRKGSWDITRFDSNFRPRRDEVVQALRRLQPPVEFPEERVVAVSGRVGWTDELSGDDRTCVEMLGAHMHRLQKIIRDIVVAQHPEFRVELHHKQKVERARLAVVRHAEAQRSWLDHYVMHPKLWWYTVSSVVTSIPLIVTFTLDERSLHRHPLTLVSWTNYSRSWICGLCESRYDHAAIPEKIWVCTTCGKMDWSKEQPNNDDNAQLLQRQQLLQVEQPRQRRGTSYIAVHQSCMAVYQRSLAE